jgi:hypothetical protein
LSIPKVNPNPRPPNEPKPGRYTPAGPQTYEPPTTTGGQGGTGGGATSTQQSRLDKLLAKFARDAKMPSVPGPAAQTPLTAEQVQASLSGGAESALGLSSFTPTAGQPDPRTPDYWRNVNNLLFNTQGRIRELNLQGTREQLDRERQTADMQTNRGREQRSLGESAIRSGLANSGWLSRNEAEQSTDYLRNYEDMQTGYERSAADRKTSISQAIQDYIAGEGDAAGSALSDYFATQQEQAQSGNPQMTPADIAAIAKILKPKKGKGGKGGGSGPTYEPPKRRR